MTNQDKAKLFMKANSDNDPRCNMLIMFMSAMFMITPEQVLTQIKKLAEEE
jgi:hypothetical protein